jgi:hypothetical protein
MNTTELQAVTFGREGDSSVFQIFGWSAPEPGFTWSVGKECGLAFPPMNAPAGFMIELEYAIFRPLDLEVRVNDATVASCTADAPGTLVWRAPAIRGLAPVRLTFRHPNSQKPSDIVDSDDGRALGLQCRRLRLLRLELPDMDALAAAGPGERGGQTCAVPAFPDLASLERIYRDEASIHRQIHDTCERAMAMDSRLRAHREHVERNELGFGDRASYWLWKLVIDAMPAHFKSLEIGVYKGQVTSLLAMLAVTAGKTLENLAVTPLGAFGDKYSRYEEADYLAAIRSIEAWSGISEARRARIIRGFSDDDGVKRQCREVAPFDLVYIDGCHDYHVVANDIITYTEMLKPGGLLLMDDASAGLDLPAGIWPGHTDVGRAVRDIIEPMRGFSRIVAVGQLLVWRKATGSAQPAPARSGGTKQDRALPDGETSSEISFGIDGNDSPCLISGWGGPEPGFRWSVDAVSRFTMRAGLAHFFILELECRPCTWPGLSPAQRIVLRVNGQPAGATEINDRATIAFAFPRPVGAGELFEFSLEFPDAAAPAGTDAAGDRHLVAIAMMRARLFPARSPVAEVPRLSAITLPEGTPIARFDAEAMRLAGIGAADLVGRFEGIGQDCEFGIFQRACGAEPLALFRFAGIETSDMIRGLDADFEGIDDPANISAVLYHPTGDFHIHQDKYRFRYHTYSYAKDITAAAVEARHAKLLSLLRRIFFERIANAERIFVLKRNRPVSDAEALAVFRALTRHGPATLLYVTLADPTHRAGSVEVVGQRLMKGYIDSFWVHGVATFSFAHWLEICLNARKLSTPLTPGGVPSGGVPSGEVMSGRGTE